MSQPASITFHCNCGRAIKAKSEHAGKKAACPSCKQVVVIPGSAPGSSAAMAPPPTAGGARPVPAPAAAPTAPAMPPSPGNDLFQSPPMAPPAPNAPVPGPANYHAPPGNYPPQAFPGQVPGPPAHNPPGMAPPPHAPNMANETCPGCGSFLPVSQQTCGKCRYDRASGRILPYQNMVKPMVRQPEPYKPTPKQSSVFTDTKTEWGVIGMGLLTIGGGAVWLVGGFVLLDVIFIYPFIMFVIGTGMIFKGIVGS